MKFQLPRGHARRTVLWTHDDLRRLRELIASGASLQVMALQLRRTPNAVRAKANLHGLSLRKIVRADSAGSPVAPPPQGNAQSQSVGSCSSRQERQR